MKNRILPIVAATFLFCCTSLFAQQKGYLTGTVTLESEIDGGDNVPGVGTMVLVVSGSEDSKKDTLYTVVGDKGNFTLRNIPVGEAFVKFSLVGFEDMARTMTIKNGENKVIVNLSLTKEQLAEAVVRETVQAIGIKEDTITFNPNAVKVNKGEMAIDVLEQMPGVEVGDGGVKILNESLATVYIDGALLFSDNPMAALEQLPAEEVANIKSFTEYSNKDPNHKVSKTEQKQRVIDIETKSKPKMVTNGDFLAGGGFDTDTTYHKFRYTAGGNVNMSSESLQAGLNFNVNNINDASSRRRGNRFRQANGGGSADLRALSVSANVNKKWMSKEARNFALGSIGGSYSFSDNYQVNESITQLLYFPNEKYDYRETNTNSYSDATTKSHRFQVNGMKSLKDGRISLNANYSINHNFNNSVSSNYNKQDDLPKQGTATKNNSNSTSNSFNTNFSFNKGFNNKVYLWADVNVSKGVNDGLSAKIDSTTSTITTKVLDITTDSNNRNLNFNPGLFFNVSDNTQIDMDYSYENSRNVTERHAVNVSDPDFPVVDTVNTEHLTNDNNVHRGSVSFRHYFEKIKANMDITLGYSSTGLNKIDAFPEEDVYGHRFNSFNPSFRMGTESMINHWNVRYSSSNSTPSLEQVRPRLDNSNLYSVSAGNPNLKQSRSHNLQFNYSTVLGKSARELLKAATEGNQGGYNRWGNNNGMGQFSTFSINGSFRMNSDVIVSKRTYFAEDTYLPEYDYTMPAQSTFTSYENVDNSYSANFSSSIETQLKKINCILNVSASMSWDNSPSYVNDVLTNTDNFRPSLNIGLNSNFSRNFRFNIRTNGSYVYSRNSEKDDVKYFTERVTVGFELNNILQHIYAGGNYNKVFTQGLDYGQTNDNILNLNIGARFGPRNNIDIALTANDIFNKNTGFSTSMASDYVRNSWTHNFGRHVMLTVAYRFNSMKGGGGNFGGRGARGNFNGGGFEGGGRW